MSIDYLKGAASRGVRQEKLPSDGTSVKTRRAFVTHSGADLRLAKGLANLLAEVGWSIDLDDSAVMAGGTVNATAVADRQRRIEAADYFLYLATANAGMSRWCWWEMGYATAVKSSQAILVVPTTDGVSVHGEEFLGLYRSLERIEKGGLAAYSHNGGKPIPLRLL